MIKKRRVLKGWVLNILLVEQTLLLFTLGGETSDIKVFIISKIMALVLLYSNHRIIKKYTDLYKED